MSVCVYGHVSGEMYIQRAVPCFLVLDTHVCDYECREGKVATWERKKLNDRMLQITK